MTNTTVGSEYRNRFYDPQNRQTVGMMQNRFSLLKNYNKGTATQSMTVTSSGALGRAIRKRV